MRNSNWYSTIYNTYVVGIRVCGATNLREVKLGGGTSSWPRLTCLDGPLSRWHLELLCEGCSEVGNDSYQSNVVLLLKSDRSLTHLSYVKSWHQNQSQKRHQAFYNEPTIFYDLFFVFGVTFLFDGTFKIVRNLPDRSCEICLSDFVASIHHQKICQHLSQKSIRSVTKENVRLSPGPMTTFDSQ